MSYDPSTDSDTEMAKLPANPADVEDWEEYPHPYNQNADGNEDEEGCLVCTVCGDHAAAVWHEGPSTFERRRRDDERWANRTLTVSDLTRLAMLAEAVEQGRKIARLTVDGDVEWGVARAWTHDGGNFLGPDDDVRDGFIWVSAGNRYTERWWPVSELLAGMYAGEVSTDYQP